MPAPLLLVTLAGPDGPFHVAISDRGVVAAETGGDPDAFEATVAARFQGLAPPGTPEASTWRRIESDLVALLDGSVRDVARVAVDVRDRAPFDQRVFSAVRDVPWGRTASYGEIARRVGAPRAARAVGGAVGRCPVSLLIPCHRIIAADGTIGGYGGDGRSGRLDALDRKRELLLREGVTVASRAP
jgi:AraC family transcriptional regulator of adaptative response/methylated-DNA-[protein]-cysteine methyltransferase